MKKVTQPEFKDKSEEFRTGYLMAEDCFNSYIKDERTTPGGASFRTFVETVAGSIKNREAISRDRLSLIDYILKYDDSEFNKGVHSFLVKTINKYNTKVKQ